MKFGECEVEVRSAWARSAKGLVREPFDLPMRSSPALPGIPLPIGSTPMTRSNPAFRNSPIVRASTVSGVTRHTILKSRGAG